MGFPKMNYQKENLVTYLSKSHDLSQKGNLDCLCQHSQKGNLMAYISTPKRESLMAYVSSHVTYLMGIDFNSLTSTLLNLT